MLLQRGPVSTFFSDQCETELVTTLLPIAMPVFLSLMVPVMKETTELFIFTLIGGCRYDNCPCADEKQFQKLVIALLLAPLNLIVSQLYANASGIAHGDIEPSGVHLFTIGVFVVFYHLFAILVAFECYRSLSKDIGLLTINL